MHKMDADCDGFVNLADFVTFHCGGGDTEAAAGSSPTSPSSLPFDTASSNPLTLLLALLLQISTLVSSTASPWT
ncbi:unnamed protein product [Urochloa humidicola]